MVSGDDFKVELLSGNHQREAFCCGVEALDAYFHERARQDMRHSVTSPFVLVHLPSNSVAGFYTLANTAVDLTEMPIEQSKKLPKYPLLPATLLGRLAVDLNHRGKGLGETLLYDALWRSLNASKQVASFAVVVNAKNEQAVAFYQRYNFIPFPRTPKKLFLTMKIIAQLRL